MEDLALGARDRPLLRAGSSALTLIASPLKVDALRALAEQPLSLQELIRLLGFPPRSTARLHLRTLEGVGAVERSADRELSTPGDYKLAPPGEKLLDLVDVVQAWLDRSPAGSIQLGSTAGKSAIKALVEGWGATVVAVLAVRPLSLTELDSLIPQANYPSLGRRLTALRQVGLLDAQPRAGRSIPFAVTEWLRRAVIPLVAAMSWEHRHLPEQTPPIRRLDIETTLLLAAPLLRLDASASGSCRVAVEVRDDDAPLPAGAVLSFQEGRAVSCVAHLEGDAEAWASGAVDGWLRFLADCNSDELKTGGKTRLVNRLLAAFTSETRVLG